MDRETIVNKIGAVVGREVTIRVDGSNVDRKGMLMKSGKDAFKIIGRPTIYLIEDILSIIGTTIRIK